MKPHYSIPAICAVLFFFSCSKDSYTPPFTSEELKLIPYTGSDTIVFTDSIGNSLTLVSSAREESFNDPVRQSRITLIENSNSLSRHYWSLLLNKSGSKDESLTILHCEIDSTDTICGDGFALQVSDDELMFYNQSYSTGSTGELLNTVTFGNESYSDVFKINHVESDVVTPGSFKVNTVYYNAAFGILGFEVFEGDTWYLKR